MIVRVKRLSDVLVAIKLVLEVDILLIISAHATQARLNESVKRQFLEEMNGLIQEIPTGEKIFLGE